MLRLHCLLAERRIVIPAEQTQQEQQQQEKHYARAGMKKQRYKTRYNKEALLLSKCASLVNGWGGGRRPNYSQIAKRCRHRISRLSALWLDSLVESA